MTSKSNNTNKSSSSGGPGVTLSLEQLLATIPTSAIKDPKNHLEKHSLSGKQILALPPSGLSFFSSLRQLDLSDNLLVDLTPLSHMPSLRHLNISKNNISNLSPLRTVAGTLTVLDVSAQKNKKLTTLASMFLVATTSTSSGQQQNTTSGSQEQQPAKKKRFQVMNQNQPNGRAVFANLKTIIATDNNLQGLGFVTIGNNQQDEGVSCLPVLDTLVLSRNPNLGLQQRQSRRPRQQQEKDDDNDDQDDRAENSGGVDEAEDLELTYVEESDLWSSITYVAPTLRKISLSDCGIEKSLPADLDLHLLHEFRLAKNRLQFFPNTIRLKSLQILDVSHNKFESLDSIGRFPFLKHLSVQGNPYMLHTNEKGDTKASSLDVGAKNKSLAKQMKEFLAFLYLFLKDLQTVDGKKFDRAIVRTSLDKITCRKVKVRVTRKIKQGVGLMDDNDDDDEQDEEAKDHHQNGQKGNNDQQANENEEDKAVMTMIGHNEDEDGNEDQEDDGANDPSIMMRRRRRREEDDDDDNSAEKKSKNPKKKPTNVAKTTSTGNSDDDAIDAEAFLKGAAAAPSKNAQLAAKAIQSIKRRPTLDAKQQQQQKGGSKATAFSTTTTNVSSLLQQAAEKSKNISQW